MIEPPSATPAPPPAPAPAVAGYELPSAGQVVGRGFELMVASTAQLRQTSFYFGGLFVAFLGPLVVLAVLVIVTAPGAIENLGDLLAGSARTGPRAQDAGWLTAVTLLVLGLYIGATGVAVVAAEGGIVAIAILAGRRLGRPIGLRQALIRSRKVIWRVVVAGIIVSIVGSIGQWILRLALHATGFPDEGSSVVALLVAAVLVAPWAYAPTGVVLGDVGATEAIRRSVQLFRARPFVGIAIALFPAIFNFVELAGLSQGGDVLLRVADATGLGFDSDALHGAVTVVLLIAAVAATGSLLFTVGALFAAPQVVAFLGLTHYAGGLDRAATPAAPAPAAATAMPVPVAGPDVAVPGPGPGAGAGGLPPLVPPAVAPSALPGVVPAVASTLAINPYAAPPRLGLPGRSAPPALTLVPRFAGAPALAPATAGPSSMGPMPSAPAYAMAPPADPGAGFHWITRGMLAAIALGAMLALLGISNLAGSLAG